MALLRRAGLFSPDLQGAEITRACSMEDLLAAYRLTHDIFVRQGYVSPDPTQIRVRVYEALPETATFVAKLDRRVVGVTSIVIDSPDLGLPTEKAFADELEALRAHGRKVCEGTNWLVADSHRNSAVMTELMRCAFAHAVAVGCTDFLGTVSPGHARFYGLLGFEQLGPVRSYSKDIHDPVVLVRLDLTALEERFRNVTAGKGDVESFLKSYYIEDNPYHRFVGTWDIVAGRLFADPTLLRELFVRRSRLLERCTDAQRAAIARHWDRGGRKVFEQVWQPQLEPQASS